MSAAASGSALLAGPTKPRRHVAILLTPTLRRSHRGLRKGRMEAVGVLCSDSSMSGFHRTDNSRSVLKRVNWVTGVCLKIMFEPYQERPSAYPLIVSYLKRYPFYSLVHRLQTLHRISDFASRIIFPSHNMAGYGHPYVIHAANLVSRLVLCLCREACTMPPFQAAAQQQQQQQEPVRVAHEQVLIQQQLFLISGVNKSHL